MQNYIRISDKRIFTPKTLELMGLDLQNETVLRQAGFVPVIYPYPVFDGYMERMEPDGDPQFDAEKNCYVQAFKVLPLDEAQIAANLESLASEKANEARKAADEAVAPYMAEFSDVEKQTWAKQQAEVAAYLTDNSASTPTLDGLAEARGISRELMLGKAIAKVTAFEPLSVAIVGKQQAYEDAIKSLVANESKSLEERIRELQAMTFIYSLSQEA